MTLIEFLRFTRFFHRFTGTFALRQNPLTSRLSSPFHVLSSMRELLSGFSLI